jgi:hypothetical protein
MALPFLLSIYWVQELGRKVAISSIDMLFSGSLKSYDMIFIY